MTISGRLLLILVAGALAIALAAPASIADSDSALPDRSEILRKLTEGQYKALDAELSSYQQQYERDPARETDAVIAFEAFDSPSPVIVSGLADWVKASPNSYAAAVAYATSLNVTALRWRGGGWANQVTPEQWKKVHEYFAQANAQTKRALSINPRLSVAYRLRLYAATDGGDLPDVMREGDQALKRVPESFVVREAMMRSLQPKWFGSRAAMTAFAEKSQSYVSKNPAIRFLRVWPTIDQCEDLDYRRQYDEAAACYTRAIDESDGQYWLPYRRRAQEYYSRGEFQLSLQDAMRADALFPMRSSVLRLLAYDTAKLKRNEASVLYIAEYLKFEMADPDMLQLLRSQQPALDALRNSE